MIRTFTLCICLASPAMADVPNVVTDIAPIHSLTARIMEGVGTPDLLLPPSASPHDYAMRPSDAATLRDADLIVWVGPVLTPWLADPLATLAPDATQIVLQDSPIAHLPLRDADDFALVEDEEEDDHNHNHDHEGSIDPHVWLDPANTVIFMAQLTDALTAMDPENKERYEANLFEAVAETKALQQEVNADLNAVRGKNYVVPHDALHYFEDRFDMPAAGAVTFSDDAPSGPAHLAALRDRISKAQITCILSDAASPTDHAAMLRDDTIKGGVMDPLGVTLTPGPDLYPTLIRNLADELIACLS